MTVHNYSRLSRSSLWTWGLPTRTLRWIQMEHSLQNCELLGVDMVFADRGACRNDHSRWSHDEVRSKRYGGKGVESNDVLLSAFPLFVTTYLPLLVQWFTHRSHFFLRFSTSTRMLGSPSSCKTMNCSWTRTNSHAWLDNVRMELQNKYPRAARCGGEKETPKTNKGHSVFRDPFATEDIWYLLWLFREK